MPTHHDRWGPLLTIGTLGFAFLISSSVTAQSPPIHLPACGADPNANTRTLQQAIDVAAPGLHSRAAFGRVRAREVRSRTRIDLLRRQRPSAPQRLEHRNRTALTLAGDDDGTSVLKLDPNPPRDANGHHAYCGDTHVVLINGSSFVGLRGFTTDGSDGELPEDGNAFACGFPSPWIFDGPLPRNAFVKPSGQTVTGLIGHTVACQPPPMTKF